MTQEASTNQQYINVSMFRVSVPRRARIRLSDRGRDMARVHEREAAHPGLARAV